MNKENNETAASVRVIIEEVCGLVCDHLCMYNNTADENGICEYIKSGNTCPLDYLT